MNRQNHATRPNEKWLTDVTEFKYYAGPVIHKVYLSVIPDLCDRRIVSYVIRDTNYNEPANETFDRTVAENLDAHPLFHNDRGIRYTMRVFYDKLAAAGMTQSMSRVGKCIDNGPMEGFRGILKRERYYGKEELMEMIEDYILYYNSQRFQRGLGVFMPLEKHALAMAA